MDQHEKKPGEWTYSDYREEVKQAGEVAVMSHLEYTEDYPELHDAVKYAISGDNRFTNYGHMLMTVLLSDQHPDAPDYTGSWDTFINFDDDPSWADCVSQMARVCYYSDVMDYVVRELREDTDAA